MKGKLKDSCQVNLAVAEEKAMTLQQIAATLGVSNDVVRNCVRRVFPNKMGQGKAAYFNEGEVAVISKELKTNTHVLSHLTSEESSDVKAAKTDLEILANARLAMQELEALYTRKLAELQTENEQLQIELDQSKEWYSVKRVLIETGTEYSWRPLKKYSDKHGYDVKKVFDQNYGEVNAYHIDVWHKVYGVEL